MEGDSIMTPGQLVKAVSIALDVSEETVVQHDRNLVVAGLRTKGGRGSSAPSVTPRDAARLVAAVLASVKVKDTVSVVQSLEATKMMTGRKGYTPLPFPRFGQLPLDHSFIDALTAIIEDADTPQMYEDFAGYARLFGGLWVHVQDWSASISYLPNLHPMGMIDIVYMQPRSEKALAKRQRSDWDWLDFLGVEQDRKIRGNCLMMLGRFFQQDEPSSAETVFRSWQSALKRAAA
jgi:hypothetical protein